MPMFLEQIDPSGYLYLANLVTHIYPWSLSAQLLNESLGFE